MTARSYLGVGLLVCLVACSSERSEFTGRKAEIYSAIEDNLTFNVHCWCRAADSETVRRVRETVRTDDVPVLIDLMFVKREQVGLGAGGVIVALGPEALPALKTALAKEPDAARRFQLEKTIDRLDAKWGK